MRHQPRGASYTTVLAVHGIQGTYAAWLPVAKACESQARFVMPNLRGRGDAFRGQDPGDYTLRAFADDLQQVVRDRLGASPFILAGWSMGVSVILEYLRLADIAKPQGLILLSGTPALSLTPWFTQDGDRLLDEVAEREKRLGLRQAADHQAVAWTWEAIQDTDHRASLASVNIPTLIIHGTADNDTPVDHAHWLAEGIAHADLSIVDGAGHNLLTENTELVSQKIGDFIGATTTYQEA
ncbi:alpha/beta fold hydrolase [Halomonas kalidii]|uniref:Alpha/beta hydrolase n=1 Tax=Halomonas kalidii TaxID=3043293 RepID=A0ABT6VGV1_9GAMM|nr:alpha/beta hydrolase [Halomonas kalidii]MDI5932208.1 alpha/beta hydrolase [Halomonas kalidii]